MIDAQMRAAAQVRVLNMIRRGRRSQDAKWGVQSHAEPVWRAIQMEEHGEAAQEMLDIVFGTLDGVTITFDKWISECIQETAVLVAMLEDALADPDAFIARARAAGRLTSRHRSS